MISEKRKVDDISGMEVKVIYCKSTKRKPSELAAFRISKQKRRWNNKSEIGEDLNGSKTKQVQKADKIRKNVKAFSEEGLRRII